MVRYLSSISSRTIYSFDLLLVCPKRGLKLCTWCVCSSQASYVPRLPLSINPLLSNVTPRLNTAPNLHLICVWFLIEFPDSLQVQNKSGCSSLYFVDFERIPFPFTFQTVNKKQELWVLLCTLLLGQQENAHRPIYKFATGQLAFCKEFTPLY